MDRSLLRRIEVKNYKSLANVVVDLEPFTVLVGPNGSGKSNFVDALRFVHECLAGPISLALQNRGGINAVRRHSLGHPTNFGFRLVIDLNQGGLGDYSFEIAAKQQGRFTVKQERCVVQQLLKQPFCYEVENGRFTKEVPGIRPRIEADRLALSLVSALEEFKPLYDFLIGMRFYVLAPDQIRQLQEPDAGEILQQTGGNAAAVLREIHRGRPDTYERLCRLLNKVVPGTSRAEYRSVGPKETLRFRQEVSDKAPPWSFDALSMSDGTLRVLGILLAIYQVSTPTFIAIEEPEATIHPAALEVVLDILKDGEARSQVLITTHSPDILDNRKILDGEIRAVKADKGQTIVSPADPKSRELIRRHLYTPGELLRNETLEPDIEEFREKAGQLRLFGTPESPRKP